MANISPIKVTKDVSLTLLVPTYKVEFQITSSDAGDNTVLNDFTGVNAFRFPQDLGTLTEAQRVKLIEKIAEFLIQWKLGNE